MSELNLSITVYPVPKSWKPFAKPFVDTVSPEPDLVDACDPISKFPTAANNVVQSSCSVSYTHLPLPTTPYV